MISFQEFGSKKLINSQFKYDFKQNLAQGQSNCISLVQLQCQEQRSQDNNTLLGEPAQAPEKQKIVLLVKV